MQFESKGIFFRTRDLQPYTSQERDAIILSAMGKHLAPSYESSYLPLLGKGF